MNSVSMFALAGGGFSLNNTNVVVSIAFIIFIGVLIYFGVHKKVSRLLDDRANNIRSELDEAQALRDEARALLASYERKQGEVNAQSEAIKEQARRDAEAAAERAKEDLKASIARRLQAAKDQSASAEAMREVKDRAVAIAVAAAGDVIRGGMSEKDAANLIDGAIKEVGAKLH
ncbi:MAG: ATP F0F1 synthase subunit B [Paracoccaceae bacterium]